MMMMFITATVVTANCYSTAVRRRSAIAACMTPPQESRRQNPYLLAAASVAGVGLDDESRCALRAPQAAECPVAERSAREGTGATGQLSLSEARDLMRQMREHDAAQDWGGIVQLGKRLLRTFFGACSPPQTCTVATVSTVSV